MGEAGLVFEVAEQRQAVAAGRRRRAPTAREREGRRQSDWAACASSVSSSGSGAHPRSNASASLVRAPVAGDQHPPVRRQAERRAPPVGGDPAGALDDRQHRAEIVGLEARFDDQIDEAQRDAARRRSNRRRSARAWRRAATRAKAAASAPLNMSGLVAKTVAAASAGQGRQRIGGAVMRRRAALRRRPSARARSAGR